MASVKTRAHRRGPKGQTLRSIGWTIRTLVVLGLLGGSGYAFCRYLQESEHYRVRTIRIQGARVLDPDEIIAACGVTCSDNLLFISAGDIRGRVEAMPYVKECEVTRVFPDLLVISVREREAAATLVVNNHTFEVDGECVVLRELPADIEHPGPLLSLGPELGTVEPGQVVSDACLGLALRVWDAFNSTDMADRLTVSEIVALDANDVRMYCDELGYEIRWAEGAPRDQARRLEILWEELAGDIPCSEYLDLRWGRDLACK